MQSRPGKCPICNSTSELELFDGDARHLYDVKCPRWTRCRRACSSPTPGAICAAAAAAPSASQPGPHGTPPAAKASLTSGSGLRAAASAYRLSPGLDLGGAGSSFASAARSASNRGARGNRSSSMARRSAAITAASSSSGRSIVATAKPPSPYGTPSPHPLTRLLTSTLTSVRGRVQLPRQPDNYIAVALTGIAQEAQPVDHKGREPDVALAFAVNLQFVRVQSWAALRRWRQRPRR